MNETTVFNEKIITSTSIPNFIAEKKHFERLIAIKGLNFRKVAYEYINEVLGVPKSESTLKQWFLYPEAIPANQRKVIVTIMIEGLHEALRSQQKMINDMNSQIQESINEYQKLNEEWMI